MKTWSFRFLTATVLTGVAAGAGGVALTLLLHLVQHLAFGYTEASFLTGVERASPLRRILALGIGGLVVGMGWWALRGRRPDVPTVEKVLAGRSGRMPTPSVSADAALQIVAVGFGASLGREGAPRQLGAAFAGWLSERLDLDPAQRRTMLACGAGAGLASVYNVPLGGALFTLEVLLASAAVRDVVPALLSSTVATVVAWPVLSSLPIYAVPSIALHPIVLLFAALLGPIAGLTGRLFLAAVTWARTLAPRGRQLPIAMAAVFTCLGAMAIGYPQLPGNGKGLAQLAFDGSVGVGTLLAVLILKPVATAACLASGARGGLLTPSLATGAVLGALAGLGWSAIWPGQPVAGFALLGAAATLATTMRAPLCAMVLVLEFTHTGLELLAPMAICVAGAICTGAVLDRSAKAART